jgi:hypothetical protein
MLGTPPEGPVGAFVPMLPPGLVSLGVQFISGGSAASKSYCPIQQPSNQNLLSSDNNTDRDGNGCSASQLRRQLDWQRRSADARGAARDRRKCAAACGTETGQPTANNILLAVAKQVQSATSGSIGRIASFFLRSPQYQCVSKCSHVLPRASH